MSMVPSRKLAACFAGVFLIGALAGGLVTWGFTDRQLSRFMSHTSDPEDKIIARIKLKYVHDYQLTPNEMTKIDPLILQMAHQLYQTRHQFGVDVLQTLDTYHQRIGMQLTPEHRAAYMAYNAKHEMDLRALLLPDVPSVTPTTP
jgi:hypothetical protein